MSQPMKLEVVVSNPREGTMRICFKSQLGADIAAYEFKAHRPETAHATWLGGGYTELRDLVRRSVHPIVLAWESLGCPPEMQATVIGDAYQHPSILVDRRRKSASGMYRIVPPPQAEPLRFKRVSSFR